MTFYLSFVTHTSMSLTKIFFLCIGNGRFYCSLFDSSRRYSTQMTSTQGGKDGVVMNWLQVNCGVVLNRFYAVKFQDVGRPARKTQIWRIPPPSDKWYLGLKGAWKSGVFLNFELSFFFVVVHITLSITTDNQESPYFYYNSFGHFCFQVLCRNWKSL